MSKILYIGFHGPQLTLHLITPSVYLSEPVVQSLLSVSVLVSVIMIKLHRWRHFLQRVWNIGIFLEDSVLTEKLRPAHNIVHEGCTNTSIKIPSIRNPTIQSSYEYCTRFTKFPVLLLPQFSTQPYPFPSIPFSTPFLANIFIQPYSSHISLWRGNGRFNKHNCMSSFFSKVFTQIMYLSTWSVDLLIYRHK